MTNSKTNSIKEVAAPNVAQVTAGSAKEWRKTKLIHPSQIRRREGFNVRVDFGDIESLAGSMKAENERTGQALLKEISVQRDKEDPNLYWLVDGDRRLTAAEFLFTEQKYDVGPIKAQVHPHSADYHELRASMVVHNSSKEFLPIEEATLYHSLKQEGWSLNKICEYVGKSTMLVQSRIQLLEHGSEEVIESIKKGDLQVQTAQEIVRQNKDNPDEQNRLGEKASKGKSQAKEVRQELKQKASANKKKKVVKDSHAVKRLTQEEVNQLATLYASKVESFEEAYGIKPDSSLVNSKFAKDCETEMPNYRVLGNMMRDFGSIEGMAMALGLE